MPDNVEHITLRYPEDTVVEISGSPDIVAQLIEQLNGVEISYSRRYFGKEHKTNDSKSLEGSKDA